MRDIILIKSSHLPKEPLNPLWLRKHNLCSHWIALNIFKCFNWELLAHVVIEILVGDVPTLNTELGWSWIFLNKFLSLLFDFPVIEFIRWGRVKFAFYFHLYQSLLNISSMRRDKWSNDWYKLNIYFQQSQGNFFLMLKLILKFFVWCFYFFLLILWYTKHSQHDWR